MNLVTGFVVYICIWWVVFFIVLAIKQHVPTDNLEKGHASSAPSKPRILLRMVITTLISALLWIGAYYLITYWLLPQPNTNSLSID